MKIKFITILFIIYSQSVYAVNSFKFTVSPPIILLKLHPGSTEIIDLSIHNNDKTDLKLNLKTYSLSMDEFGNALVAENEDQQVIHVSWLQPEFNTITIPPDSGAVVSVKINVPFGVSGGKYGVVMFETSQKVRGQNKILLTGRMGSIVMIEIYGRKQYDSKLVDFSVNGQANPVNFAVTIWNNGNLHINVKGSIMILGEDNRIVDRINLNVGTGTILPNHRRIFSAVWKNVKKMKPGQYIAKVRIIVPGVGKVIEEEKAFIIK